MGYIIINRDEEEMGGLRQNMRRTMMRGGSSAMMRHHEGYDNDKMYETGFRHGWEDAEEEHYRRMRDSRGRYM